jgi:predicted PurR-regulated permease PerM
MNLTRPVAFWIAVLAAFVAGMLLAYLLDPLATRLERLGMNRLIATLTIVELFVVGVTALIKTE